MSIIFEMMKRDCIANKALSEKYPGVYIKQKSRYIYLSDKEIMLNENRENWPDSICAIVKNLEQNAELSRIIGMNLDWFYESQEAEKYLSDTENFKNSFGLLNEEKHSVEYILYHLMRCNYEIEDCIKSETGVILECFFKEHDFSDKWNPDVKLRKAYIFLKCEEPDNTYLIVRERIKAIEHHYGSFCYGEDVEIITEMAEEEFQKLKEKRNVKDEEQQRF